MAHLIKIVSHKETNKMDSRNIGIVFTPTLAVPSQVFTLMMSEFGCVFCVNSSKTDDQNGNRKSAQKRKGSNCIPVTSGIESISEAKMQPETTEPEGPEENGRAE